MAANDGGLVLVLGRPLEAGHVLVDGLSNHARSVPSRLPSGQPIDAHEHLVVNSNCNSLHIVDSTMDAGLVASGVTDRRPSRQRGEVRGAWPKTLRAFRDLPDAGRVDNAVPRRAR